MYGGGVRDCVLTCLLCGVTLAGGSTPSNNDIFLGVANASMAWIAGRFLQQQQGYTATFNTSVPTLIDPPVPVGPSQVVPVDYTEPVNVMSPVPVWDTGGSMCVCVLLQRSSLCVCVRAHAHVVCVSRAGGPAV